MIERDVHSSDTESAGADVVETACKAHPRSENRLHRSVTLAWKHNNRVGFGALYKVCGRSVAYSLARLSAHPPPAREIEVLGNFTQPDMGASDVHDAPANPYISEHAPQTIRNRPHPIEPV